MTRIGEVPGGLQDDLEGVCIICGRETELAWFGEEVLEICEECAVQILPRMIADVGFGDVESVWNKATYYYYRALTNRFENKI